MKHLTLEWPQRVIDIPVSDPDDEVTIFSDIRRRWLEHRGRWQRLFHFHGVVAVKEVKFRFVHSYGDQLVVLVKYIEEQTEQRRQELESSRQELEIFIDRITNFEEVQFPSSCYFDTATGVYNHKNS